MNLFPALRRSLFILSLTITFLLPNICFGQRTSNSNIPAVNLRMSFVGSSVTWSDGFLQSGLVKETILNTQKHMADVVGPRDVVIKGANSLLNTPNDRKFFDGVATRITGVNSEISFSLEGNEVSIVQGIERSNTNAAEIEVYIDDVLYDTFNNWNTSPVGKETKSFKGDGKTSMFNLGRAFTYNHNVTVSSALKKGSHNLGGYSGGIVPASDDYMIVRKYGKDRYGNPEVHHWVYFKVIPKNGEDIVAGYDYGEEISYEKTTIGKTGKGVLESPFGDGDVSFDLTKPARISSGLDFRQTDERAVKKYRFATNKKRTVRLKIKGNYIGASGTPYFIFNFATNRFFHFQNAGIGGWKLKFLNDPEEFHRSYKKVVEFAPDIVMLETTPNDDWTVKGHKVYTEYKDLSIQELQSMRTLPAKNITFNEKTGKYKFQKWAGKIEAVQERGITISAGDKYGIAAKPVKGDYVFIGGYFSNNKEYAVRRVSSYNDKTREITFDRPISTADFIYDDLKSLVGLEVRVRSFEIFENELRQFISNIRSEQPSAKISVISNPLPVVSARELWGYWDVIDKIAGETQVENLRVSSFYDYQYSQIRDQALTLDASLLKTDPVSGFQEADLKIPAGRNCLNFEVLVNGKNVYGKDAVVYNGYSYGIDPSKTGAGLNMDNSNDGIQTNQKINRIPRIVFLKNAPTSGTISIKYSSKKWSGDGCHVRDNDDGSKLYGQVYYDFIKKQ
ncbi:hypothetical protein ABDJ41_19440 [Pedobacter sp. ASV1-7]|uniref:hypothetical protein n=1 Tax=Pedobacter sp. ASV1-7 TaxID=3145237 RepID=UPI0032E8EB72